MAPPQRPPKKTGLVGGALFGIVVLGGLFPLWYSRNKKIDHNKPLVGEAMVRGAYMNAGSRDIGPDPDYKPIQARWQGPNA